MNTDLSARERVLHALLACQQPLEKVLSDLARFGWDAERAVVSLNARHVVDVLQRFVRGDVSAQEIEDWANAIEGRDDIATDESASGVLAEAMFALANPALQGVLDVVSAKRWVERLQRLSGVRTST